MGRNFSSYWRNEYQQLCLQNNDVTDIIENVSSRLFIGKVDLVS